MATFLFDEIVFGPVRSRRLGVSLGINLLPVDKKFCNFDCIYCECGWTSRGEVRRDELPGREEVRRALEEKILAMAEEDLVPDVITYAGNGEPTLHPHFEGIVDDSLEIRERLCPEARIAVLSNATMLHKKSVFRGLKKSDQPILKLDTTVESTYRLINQPLTRKSIATIIKELKAFGPDAILQTLFLKGRFRGEPVDNTTEEELVPLLEAYRGIRPASVMVYTFARDTAADHLEKIPGEKLNEIARRIEALGIPTEVSS